MREPAFWWRAAGLAAALLAPAAAVYGAAAARRMARSGAQAGVPVICAGNFTLGGTGKTPTAIMLAKMLAEAGERPFCLSRGYGGSEPGPKLVDAERRFRRAGRRRSAVAGARGADRHCARARGRRGAGQGARRQRHRHGRRLAECFARQKLDARGHRRPARHRQRQGVPRRSAAGAARSAACALRRAAGGRRRRGPARSDRTRAQPAGVSRPARARSFRARRFEGAQSVRLCRHRRSGEVLRDRARGRPCARALPSLSRSSPLHAPRKRPR